MTPYQRISAFFVQLAQKSTGAIHVFADAKTYRACITLTLGEYRIVC